MEVADHVGPGLHYVSPLLPVKLVLPNGFHVGSQISIQGTVPAHASRFSVNLQQGTQKTTSSVPFHFNPRFTEGPVVVRNSRAEGSWLQEERDPPADGSNQFPFAYKEDFCLVITPHPEWFEVVVNGKPFVNFNHRLPVESVNYLCIKGDVLVKSIHVSSKIATPTSYTIPGNLRIGDAIFIQGKVNPDAEKFAINCQCGPNPEDDVCVHFNPRFNEGCVVRNSKVGNSWGSEETDGTLPFAQGQNFDLIIAAGIEKYEFLVNGATFATFIHRCSMDSACNLVVKGDITVSRIIIDCLPCFLPQLFDARQFNSSDVQVNVVLPPVPSRIPLPGGLSTGRYVIVTFVPKADAKTFAVNLENTKGGDTEIILHVNPRWEDGPAVVLNSHVGSAWGSEVRPAGFPLKRNGHSDFVIACEDSGYKIALDGHLLTEYQHRSNPQNVDSIYFYGDVIINRVIVI